MKIDHIFIFSNENGKEANELVELGFTEGSSRIHKGQGTINRKFYFENFYLEILWVNNESEITNELTSGTKLWERSNFKTNGKSPFGLCLKNTSDVDSLFSASQKYSPEYLPKGLSIDILTNDTKASLPWTFRLPFKPDTKKAKEEIKHKNGIQKLTRVKFGIQKSNFKASFTNYFEREEVVVFEVKNKNQMTLVFDNHQSGKSICISSLNLIIEY